MALTVRGLIEKLEKVEDKSGDVFIETPDGFLRVDFVFLDNEGQYVILSNAINSHHCLCDKCKANETEL